MAWDTYSRPRSKRHIAGEQAMRRVINAAILSVVILCGLGPMVEPVRASVSDPGAGESNASSNSAETGGCVRSPRLWSIRPLTPPGARPIPAGRRKIPPWSLRRKMACLHDRQTSGPVGHRVLLVREMGRGQCVRAYHSPISKSDYYCPQVYHAAQEAVPTRWTASATRCGSPTPRPPTSPT